MEISTISGQEKLISMLLEMPEDFLIILEMKLDFEDFFFFLNKNNKFKHRFLVYY